MPQDDLQNHLDTAMYGAPLLKPEEQHKYLGTFRERCYVTMTIDQMTVPNNKTHFLDELTRHPQALVLLNGAMPLALQSAYIKLLTQQNMTFTVVNDHVSDSPESFGIILAAKEAVNEPVIDIEQKYPLTTDPPVNPSMPKKSFWKKLLHSKEEN